MKTKNGLLASVFCLLVVALCVIGLTSCDMAMFCTHEWSEYTVIEDATCSKAGIQQRTCGKCGLTETAEIAKIEHTVGPDDGDCATPINCMVCGEIAVEGKEHAGGKATCIAKAKCFYCGKEYGEVAGHVPGEDDGDCTTPVTCTLCGDTVIEAHLGHILGKDDGDCTTPVTCINCDTVMIEAKPGHRGTADGDCTTPEYCEICGKVYIEAEKEHRGGFSTCYTLACCTLCGKAYGEYAEHTPCEDDGDCTTSVWCLVCGNTIVEAQRMHIGGKATCNALAKCDICGMEYGEFASHKPGKDDGDCTTPITCMICGDITTDAQKAHIPNADDGDCTTAVTCMFCGTVTTEAKASHTGGKATCTERARCTVCNKEYGDFADHIPNADDGDCTTAVTCSICGAVTTEANETHRGGSANCSAKAHCEVCGKEYGDFAGHIPNADDGDCTTAITCSICGTVTTEANETHTPGADDGDCTTAVTCMFCETIVIHAKETHVPADDDGDCTTPITCTVCSTIITEANENHVGGAATCTEQAHCEVCGKEYGDFAGHIPNADDGDCTTAVTCSICGAVTTEANETHKGGSANCSEKAHCEVCGKEYGDLAGHIPNADDGDCTTAITCSICGTVTTEAKPSHSAETVWIKHLDSHYLVYTCCVVKASEPEAHKMVDGSCTACGFNPSMTATSLEVTPGDKKVSVAISINDNPGITGLMMTLQYNSDMFTLTKAENGEALDALTFTAPGTLDSGCTFLWDGVNISDADIKNGNVLVLTFDVSPRAFEGEYSILLKISAYDNNLNPFTLVLSGGHITVSK